MEIEVLRIGQRLVRDDRVTTHVALVSRAFGAKRIYMNEVNPQIRDTLQKINFTWGGKFEVSFIKNWRKVLQEQKRTYKIVHLTMYGQNINKIQNTITKEKNILVVVGAQKVPREVYDLADYNVAVGNQPHSEISALAVFLDRIQKGKQLLYKFPDAQRTIIPSKDSKKVIENKTRD